MLSSVIFDFDGIIVDTEPIHFQAFVETLKPEGFEFTWEEYKETALGFDDRDVVKLFFSQAKRTLSAEKVFELSAFKAELFIKIVNQTSMEPYPGVTKLIKNLYGKIPLAISSGARQSDIDAVFAKIQFKHYFDATVSTDDVEKSKPDPTSYITAVNKLIVLFPSQGIKALTSVAIEDSPAGITSALNAGLKVLAVTNNYDESHLHKAHQVVNSLENISMENLLELIE